jgi:hypothetical protein
VSKVNNEGESDATLRGNLQQELAQSLFDNKILSVNETLVFREILANNQLEIFSNPRREVPVLDKAQREQMLDMLNTRMGYIKKADAKIRVRIDRAHIPRLNAYIVSNYAKFETHLNELLERQITLYLDDVVAERHDDFNRMKQTLIQLMKLLSNGGGGGDFDAFVSGLSDEIVGLSEKKKMCDEKRVLDYFVNLLPDEFRSGFPNEKPTWLSASLVSKLNEQISSKLFKYIVEQHRLFDNEYQAVLTTNVQAYIHG